MTPLIRSTYLLSLALIGTLACKPADQTDADDGDQPATPLEVDDAAAVLAEQVCAQMYTCSCPSNVEYWVDEADCVASLTTQFAEGIDSRIASGGSWNADCAGDLAKAMSDWECLGQTSAMNESSFSPMACPVLKGSGGVGANCNRTPVGDDCQAGLTCLTNTCVEIPTLPVPIGGQCGYYELPCEAGSYCEYDPSFDTFICQALPQAGDLCSDEGYLCGPDANDLVCETGTCVTAPAEGESCEEWFLCSPGLYCDGGKNFTCQPRQEIGEGCGADVVCPVDASCVNSICTADPAAVCNSIGLLGEF